MVLGMAGTSGDGEVADAHREWSLAGSRLLMRLLVQRTDHLMPRGWMTAAMQSALFGGFAAAVVVSAGKIC